LLETARIFDVTVQTLLSPTLPHQDGGHAVIPVDVSRAYVNGRLYVPFRALESQTEQVSGPDGKTGERTVGRYRTLVLRSDGVVCTFSYLPAPRGTPKQDRVLALSDGTLLSRPPLVDEARSTFSPSAITRFREARTAGKSAMTLTPLELLERLHEHMKALSALAHEEDYALLTFVVVASYAQAVFDTVPFVQLTGPGGLAADRALLEVSCNATLITGPTPAPTAARSLDRLGGLAVIDLGGMARHNTEEELNAFVQRLSASTRKDTSGDSWTDPRTMRGEKLDLYGVKVVTGAPGAAGIFSNPVLRICSRKPAKEATGLPSSATKLQELRDNLHIWVMENVERINHLYRQSCVSPGNPQEALTAPLTVLADLTGHSSPRRAASGGSGASGAGASRAHVVGPAGARGRTFPRPPGLPEEARPQTSDARDAPANRGRL